tara:strand:- start:2071 stop:2565 length:495 start_codon:yes stop_codon:yes gene_type:complete
VASPNSPVTSSEPATPRAQGTLAARLGYGGLLPIIGCMALTLLLPDRAGSLLQLGNLYVGSIFCFLGGIQWGISLLDETMPTLALPRLLVSVLPSLWMVLALQFQPTVTSLALVLGLVGLLAFERRQPVIPTLPAWYLPLRVRLTAFLSFGLLGLALLSQTVAS